MMLSAYVWNQLRWADRRTPLLVCGHPRPTSTPGCRCCGQLDHCMQQPPPAAVPRACHSHQHHPSNSCLCSSTQGMTLAAHTCRQNRCPCTLARHGRCGTESFGCACCQQMTAAHHASIIPHGTAGQTARKAGTQSQAHGSECETSCHSHMG